MNGEEAKIEIFKPFGEAFELTKKILFQPFDLKKWCVMGFAAFLASLSSGLHFNFNGFNRNQDLRRNFSSMRDDIVGTSGQWPGWVIPLIIVVVLFFLALVAVLMWLGARGRFMFIDCIVRNRAAIKEPWLEFRAEGNSFFLFSLLVALLFLVVVALMATPIFLPLILHQNALLSRTTMIIWLVCFLIIILLLAVGWHWVSQLMVTVMYRKRCRPMAAFRDVVGLISHYPAPLTLYFLFLIVLALAAVVLGCAVICVTCCIAAIPYVGTVILLPIHVALYAFTLFFLRQFGAEYDVWGGLSPLEPASPSALPPPLQL